MMTFYSPRLQIFIFSTDIYLNPINFLNTLQNRKEKPPILAVFLLALAYVEHQAEGSAHRRVFVWKRPTRYLLITYYVPSAILVGATWQ